VKYFYFVRPIGGGRFQPAAQDFGPPESVFEPGDIHTGGARDGKVAVVLRLVKGQAANMNGGDVMMLLEERPEHDHPVSDVQNRTMSNCARLRHALSAIRLQCSYMFLALRED
jgi:hypothetical protein